MNERIKQALERLDIDIDEKNFEVRAERSVFLDERLAAAKSIGAINENSSDVELLGALAILDLMLEPPWSGAPQLKILKKLCSIDRDMCDYYRLSKKKNNWTEARFAKKHKLFRSTKQLKEFLSKLFEDDKTFNNYISKNASSDSAALVDAFYALLGRFVEPKYGDFNKDRYYALKRVFDLLYDTDYVFGPKHEQALLFLIRNGGVDSIKLNELIEKFPDIKWLAINSPSRSRKLQNIEKYEGSLSGLVKKYEDYILSKARENFKVQDNTPVTILGADMTEKKDVYVATVVLGDQSEADKVFKTPSENDKITKVRFGPAVAGARTQDNISSTRMTSNEPSTQTTTSAGKDQATLGRPLNSMATWNYTQSPAEALGVFANPTRYRAAYEDLIVQKHPIALKMKAGKSFKELLQAKDADAKELFNTAVKYIKNTIDPQLKKIHAKDAPLVKAIGDMLKESNQKKTSKSKLDSLILKEYKDFLKEQKEQEEFTNDQLQKEAERLGIRIVQADKKAEEAKTPEQKKQSDAEIEEVLNDAENLDLMYRKKISGDAKKIEQALKKYRESVAGGSAQDIGMGSYILGALGIGALAFMFARSGKGSVRRSLNRAGDIDLLVGDLSQINRLALKPGFLGASIRQGQKISGSEKWRKWGARGDFATDATAMAAAGYPGYALLRIVKYMLKKLIDLKRIKQASELSKGKHVLQRGGGKIANLENQAGKWLTSVGSLPQTPEITRLEGRLTGYSTKVSQIKNKLFDDIDSIVKEFDDAIKSGDAPMYLQAKERRKNIGSYMERVRQASIEATEELDILYTEMNTYISDAIGSASSNASISRTTKDQMITVLEQIKLKNTENFQANQKINKFYKSFKSETVKKNPAENEIALRAHRRLVKANKIHFGYIAKETPGAAATSLAKSNVVKLEKNLNTLAEDMYVLVDEYNGFLKRLQKYLLKYVGAPAAGLAVGSVVRPVDSSQAEARGEESLTLKIYRKTLSAIADAFIAVGTSVPGENYDRGVIKGIKKDLLKDLYEKAEGSWFVTMGNIIRGELLSKILTTESAKNKLLEGFTNTYKVAFISNIIGDKNNSNELLKELAEIFQKKLETENPNKKAEVASKFCQIIAQAKINGKRQSNILLQDLYGTTLKRFIQNDYIAQANFNLDIPIPKSMKQAKDAWEKTKKAGEKGAENVAKDILDLSFLDDRKKELVDKQIRRLFIQDYLNRHLANLEFVEGYEFNGNSLKKAVQDVLKSDKTNLVGNLNNLLNKLPRPYHSEFIKDTGCAEGMSDYKGKSPISIPYGEDENRRTEYTESLWGYDLAINLLCKIADEAGAEDYPFLKIQQFTHESQKVFGVKGQTLENYLLDWRNNELIRNELESHIKNVSKEFTEQIPARVVAKTNTETDRLFDRHFGPICKK